MRYIAKALGITALGLAGSLLSAQSQHLPLPTTRAAVRAYDSALVQRISTLLDSPDRWSRSDTGACPASATAFSIICALQSVLDSAAAEQRDGNGQTQSDCRFQRTSAGIEGSCGLFFQELPIFTVSRTPAVATGKWSDDASPGEVWSGTMTDAASPVRQEARRAVDAVTSKKYSARLIDFNSDSATSFADLRHYLMVLAERVAQHAEEDFGAGGDSVEVEIYPGATGVIRTYAGWYPVSGWSATDGTLHFRVDVTKQVAPNSMDRRILQRAAAILNADSVWNRADNRKCAESARVWSIYCAVQKAAIEVTGGFHHRRPAAELVRVIVEERTKDRSYEHRLMDYNNDPTTTLADVRTLFAQAIARIP